MVVRFHAVRGWWESSGKVYAQNGSATDFFVRTAAPSVVATSGVVVSTGLRGWKQRISQHVSATTPFEARTFLSSSAPSRILCIYRSRNSVLSPWRIAVSQTLRGVLAETSGSFPATPPFNGATYEEANNLATSRLYKKLREFESPSQVGESLGEIRQTAKMLRSPARGLSRLIGYTMRHHTALLKQARANNVRHTVKAAADLLLEWRFGISPLIKDLASAGEALSSRGLVIDDFAYFNVSGKSEAVSVLSPQAIVQNWINRIDIDVRDTRRYKIRYKGVYRYSAAGDPASFGKSLGLTWREFAPTMWNLFPYSFLLDYVVNLNAFIETVSVPWSNVAWCNRTARATIIRRYVPTGSGAPKPTSLDMYNHYYASIGHLELQGTHVVRSAQLSLPLPRLEWKVPSVRQLTNVAALLASRIPVIDVLGRRLRKEIPSLNRDFQVLLVKRGSMMKVPYPHHR